MWTILISPSFMYLATWFTYNDRIDILTDHQDITLQVVVVPPPFALPHLVSLLVLRCICGLLPSRGSHQRSVTPNTIGIP